MSSSEISKRLSAPTRCTASERPSAVNTGCRPRPTARGAALPSAGATKAWLLTAKAIWLPVGREGRTACPAQVLRDPGARAALDVDRPHVAATALDHGDRDTPAVGRQREAADLVGQLGRGRHELALARDPDEALRAALARGSVDERPVCGRARRRAARDHGERLARGREALEREGQRPDPVAARTGAPEQDVSRGRPHGLRDGLAGQREHVARLAVREHGDRVGRAVGRVDDEQDPAVAGKRPSSRGSGGRPPRGWARPARGARRLPPSPRRAACCRGRTRSGRPAASRRRRRPRESPCWRRARAPRRRAEAGTGIRRGRSRPGCRPATRRRRERPRFPAAPAPGRGRGRARGSCAPRSRRRVARRGRGPERGSRRRTALRPRCRACAARPLPWGAGTSRPPRRPRRWRGRTRRGPRASRAPGAPPRPARRELRRARCAPRRCRAGAARVPLQAALEQAPHARRASRRAALAQSIGSFTHRGEHVGDRLAVEQPAPASASRTARRRRPRCRRACRPACRAPARAPCRRRCRG